MLLLLGIFNGVMLLGLDGVMGVLEWVLVL